MTEPAIVASHQPRAWHYGPGGWSVIDNPLHGPDPAESRLDALRRAGYGLQPSFRLEGGRWESDYRLEVYDGKEFDHFLVCMGARGRQYAVTVDGLPQLLDLLGRLVPVVRMAAETQDKERGLRQGGEPTEGLP